MVGLSSLQRLDELRLCRDTALKALQEYRAKESIGQDNAVSANALITKDTNKFIQGMYEVASRLGERYGCLVTQLPLPDAELQKRCSTRGSQASGHDRRGLGGQDDLPLPSVLQNFPRPPARALWNRT